MQTIHTIHYRYSVPGKVELMTHSEIVQSIIDQSDMIADALKRGHDVEVRLFPKIRGVKLYELRKQPLTGAEAVQADLRRFDALG